ncbi:MAG: pyruvate kinase [Flammeovirgaceae bacterium]|nr:pyruvate kinase [Flammeovirgaceae bacterium]
MRKIFNRTKIVATVGPASNTKEKLHELIVAGVDVFRLNFSHGNHKQHQEVINHIRDLNKTFKYNVSILQDLQGPKIRIGQVEDNGVEIVEGEELIITTEQEIVGTSKKVSTTYTGLTRDVKAGDTILIDDGNLEVRVFKVDGHEVYTKVVFGGILKSRKGMNLPDTAISEPSLTKKDRKDLEFGLENDVDWIAISFVRNPGDVQELKSIVKERGKVSKVVAKIERPEAIKNIDEIIKEADGTMVARGDLGVEIQMEDVPMHQKNIVKKCNESGKPVIIATQMMESMIENPRPTRAEANDVANAVMDGTDAVMLSAETASGKYPVQTIQHMTNIVRAVENSGNIYNKTYDPNLKDSEFASNMIVSSACNMAKDTKAKAIIAITYSGFTALQIARHRPESDIYAFTENKALLTSLNLVWGVKAFYFKPKESTNATFKYIEEFLEKEGYLRKGNIIINTAAMPFEAHKKTNMVKLSVIE